MDSIREINTLQYLGNKSRIIDHICKPVIMNDEIDKVVDLFAGTGSVSYALKDHKKVISNDIEYYSYVVNQAVLNGCLLTHDEEQTFWNNAKAQYHTIEKMVSDCIEAENAYFCNEVNYKEYRSFCDNTPSVFFPYSIDGRFKLLKHLVEQVNPGGEQRFDLPCLFLTYFSNSYFGIKQCCQIDSIRHAISQTSNSNVKYVLLTALMSYMSATASTTTHFAQYLKVKDKATCRSLVEKRRMNIFDGMRYKLDEYRKSGLLEQTLEHHNCYNLDYIDCLQRLALDSSTLIYADPPYFKEHYSRYYHILNTLCLYDYPDMSVNPHTHTYTTGRYRVGRSVSNFGKKALALDAFDKLISACADAGSWLTLSYSDNSIVAIDDLYKLAEQRYDVKIDKVSLNHSNQGRVSTSKVDEYIITCRPNGSLIVIDDKLKAIKKIKPVVDNPAGFMHNYMARKPYNVVSALIKSFSPEFGTIYDPMCGSGTTIIEASKLNRNAIGTDINLIAYKICRASLVKWDIEKVFFSIDSFCSQVKKACEHLYVHYENEELRLIERCHFIQNDGFLVPTMYWYKTFKEEELSGRKKTEASVGYISSYNSLSQYPVKHMHNKSLLPNSRIAIKDGDTAFKYFCNRNLIAMDEILSVLNRFKDKYGYEIIELMVSSALNLIKLSDKKASSQMPYWLPKENATSRNAIMIIEQKAQAFKEGLVYLREECKLYIGGNDPIMRGEVVIRNIAAQNITQDDLPDNSIDLILTDPPYTDQIPYLEYSQLWDIVFNWGAITEDTMKAEMVVSDAPSRNKDLCDFNSVLSSVVNRACLALKHGGFFIMFYHTFNLKSWNFILELMNNQGLGYCRQLPLDTPRKSFKTVMSPNRTLDGNYIIVFQKSSVQKKKVFEGTLDEAKAKTIECARRLIVSQSEVTSQDLYDGGMLKEAFDEGYLGILAEDYSSLIDIIKENFDYANGTWRLK